MSDITRPKLYEKLNGLALKAMESAFVFCKLRGNPYVELDHWLHQMLQLQDSDLHRIGGLTGRGGQPTDVLACVRVDDDANRRQPGR